MQAISSITKSGARWIGRQLKLLLEEVAEDTRSALRASIKAYIVALLAGSSLTATVLAGEHVIQEQLNPGQPSWVERLNDLITRGERALDDYESEQ